VVDTAWGDEECAVGAEAREDGGGAAVAQGLARLDGVAEGAHGHPGAGGEFFEVRFDEVGPCREAGVEGVAG
jgi:hypothetical protein